MSILRDVVSVIEDVAPPELAAEWDNSGLQLGNPNSRITKVLVALDPLPAVIREAASLGCGLLVCHHPLFFRNVRRLDLSFGTGAAVDVAVRGGVAVYSAHTSLDRVSGGVNDALAKLVGIKVSGPIEPMPGRPGTAGFGRVGKLARPRRICDIAATLKSATGAGAFRLTGDGDRVVKTVAVCGGSGAELIHAAFKAGAELFVTGDVKYHDALRADELGLAALDMGHYWSERVVLAPLADTLASAFKKKKWKISVAVSRAQSEPWNIV